MGLIVAASCRRPPTPGSGSLGSKQTESGYLASSGNHPPDPHPRRGALPAFLGLRPLDPGSSIYGEKGLLNSRPSHFPGKAQPVAGALGLALSPARKALGRVQGWVPVRGQLAADELCSINSPLPLPPFPA